MPRPPRGAFHCASPAVLVIRHRHQNQGLGAMRPHESQDPFSPEALLLIEDVLPAIAQGCFGQMDVVGDLSGVARQIVGEDPDAILMSPGTTMEHELIFAAVILAKELRDSHELLVQLSLLADAVHLFDQIILPCDLIPLELPQGIAKDCVALLVAPGKNWHASGEEQPSPRIQQSMDIVLATA